MRSYVLTLKDSLPISGINQESINLVLMSVLIAEVDWGTMRRGFLGLGEMSDDDQNSVMLFVILALSLECVLEALLQGSPERFWVFHGVAVGISAWALSSGSQLGMRFAAIAGVATFLNELELLWEFDDRARLLVPTLVLLSASVTLGWKVFSADGGVTVPGRSAVRRNSRPLNPFAGYEPYLVLIGAALVVYSLAIGQWLDIERLFGLFTDSAGFSDIRKNYSDLDISGEIYTKYLDAGYLVSYASAGVGAVVYIGRLTGRLSVSSTLMLALAIGSTVAAAWHTAFVVDLMSNSDEISIGIPAWAGTAGLALISSGTWMNQKR